MQKKIEAIKRIAGEIDKKYSEAREYRTALDAINDGRGWTTVDVEKMSVDLDAGIVLKALSDTIKSLSSEINHGFDQLRKLLETTDA